MHRHFSIMARVIGNRAKAMAVMGFLLASAAIVTADPEANTLNGTYAGLYLAEFDQDVFLGMPYAQDTGGQNRFRVPQALNESWEEIRDAKQYSHACPDESMESDGVYGMSENCLSINVIRPARVNETANLPIMFWIHGGRLVIVSVLSRPSYSYNAAKPWLTIIL